MHRRSCARLRFSATVLLLLLPDGAFAERIVLHAGRLIDGVSNTVAQRRSIVVEDGRIVALENGFVGGGDDRIVDLREHTVMPGLMDMHVHLTTETSPSAYLERFTLSSPELTLRGVVNAERTLLAGFTTVRDLGAVPSVITALRDAIARGLVPGPRIFAATAALASTGGHGDPSNGLGERLRWQPTPAEGVVNSVDDARSAVRQRYKEGADLIKITATGGVLSLAKSGENPQFTVEEIRAIVETAKDYGFMVAAHAHGTEGIKRAILGGVTTVEHGTFMDEEAMRMMIEHGTVWVPTISAGRFVADKAAVPGYFPDIIRPKAAKIGPVIQETFGAAYRAGVRIAFGTDCGVCPHGSNALEFQYMVEGGMPPLEAIRSATSVTAKLLGMGAELGTLEPGKLADIVAAPGDPSQDITVLQRVSFVMKGGEIYKAPR